MPVASVTTAAPRAATSLVCSNLRLVIFAAKRYRGIAGISIQDLIEAGNVGLIQAVDRFDPERGVRLSAYAMWWIKKAMVQVIQNQRGGLKADGSPHMVQSGCADDKDLRETIADPTMTTPSQNAEDTELQRRVKASLSRLDKSHAHIVRLRFGLDGETSRSIKQIGAELGVDTKQATRMLAAALGQLKGICAWAA